MVGAGGRGYLQVLAALAREVVGGAGYDLHPHRGRGMREAEGDLGSCTAKLAAAV